jgi:pimeloyl-ACP methyl ester carboxylesterase
VRLSGTLYYPHGGRNLPLVVALHGAIEPTRDLALYTHLKQMLPPLGVAVFVFDRRGSGKSDKAQDNSLDIRAQDGVAARQALAQDPRIDPKRTGYWGLSQGGWLSVTAASRDPDASFVVSVSGPITPPDVQMVFAVGNIMRAAGYPDAEVQQAMEVRKAVDDYAKGKRDRASTQVLLDAAMKKPWFKQIYMDDNIDEPAMAAWRKDIALDPMGDLDKVKVPVLMIFGSGDPWVPVGISMDRLRESRSRHPNVEAVVIAGADHEMMLSVPFKTQMDGKAAVTMAPEAPAYFAVMAAWLARQGLTRPAS